MADSVSRLLLFYHAILINLTTGKSQIIPILNLTYADFCDLRGSDRDYSFKSILLKVTRLKNEVLEQDPHGPEAKAYKITTTSGGSIRGEVGVSGPPLAPTAKVQVVGDRHTTIEYKAEEWELDAYRSITH
jgi:hypothetical protein